MSHWVTSLVTVISSQKLYAAVFHSSAVVFYSSAAVFHSSAAVFHSSAVVFHSNAAVFHSSAAVSNLLLWAACSVSLQCCSVSLPYCIEVTCVKWGATLLLFLPLESGNNDINAQNIKIPEAWKK